MVKQVLGWLVTRQALAPLGRPIMAALNHALPLHNCYVASFRKERAQDIELIVKTRRERDVKTRVDESYFLACAARATSRLKGDIAEVGVYQGGTARLLCAYKGQRPLHLFDTFEGLPEPESRDKSFKRGEFACGLENVRRYLGPPPNTFFYKGLFPHTAEPVRDCRFSLVHLDVDLYQSTRDALEFFYLRMLPGGMIISHDYQCEAGVRQACDEFFHDKPEPILELIGTQCLIVKLGAAAADMINLARAAGAPGSHAEAASRCR